MSVADFCNPLSSADICDTNLTDNALKGSRITIGASSVSRLALKVLPLKRFRNRWLNGNSKNARNAAHVMGTKNGRKINTSA